MSPSYAEIRQHLRRELEGMKERVRLREQQANLPDAPSYERLAQSGEPTAPTGDEKPHGLAQLRGLLGAAMDVRLATIGKLQQHVQGLNQQMETLEHECDQLGRAYEALLTKGEED